MAGPGDAITRLVKNLRALVQRWTASPSPPAIVGVLVVPALALAVSLSLANFAPAPCWQLDDSEARTLLGFLLGAQAAVVALTFVVAVFALQSLTAKRNADDRMHREYVRRARVRWLLAYSVGAVGVTGALLIAAAFGSAGAPWLVIGAALASVANLALPVWLFERVIVLARPSAWRTVQHEAAVKDAQAALRVYLGQERRADSDAGAVDDAVQRLLDEARRAMDDHRRKDVEQAFDSLWQLVEYAMGELERAGVEWEKPGASPAWPPLSGLRRSLYPLREHVIGQGRREYVDALRDFDFRLRTEGVTRRCGELFTAALNGDESTYAIASQVGNAEVRASFREVFWSDFRFTAGIGRSSAQDSFPYMKEAIRYQERLLSRAMHDQHPDDFKALSQEFAGVLEQCGWDWDTRRYPPPGAVDLHEQLEQRSRIALMGLAGRAMQLAAEGRIDDPQPYLDAARGAYSSPKRLADDIVQALDFEKSLKKKSSLWLDWDSEGTPSFTARYLNLERYPLAFFSMRLLELARDHDPLPPFDLHGRAQQVRDWFEKNVDQVERFVRVPPDDSIATLRERALVALADAVRRHEIAREEDIADRPLSAARIRNFVAEVYDSIFSLNATERLFARAGAFLYLAPGSADAPEERTPPEKWLAKAPFTDQPSTGPFSDVYVAEYESLSYGATVEHDVKQRLGEALGDAPVIEAALDTPEAALRAIDQALDALDPQSKVLIFFPERRWIETSEGFDHDETHPAEYEPPWMVQGIGEWARYRGHPIIVDLDGEPGDRSSLYVVEPGAWGCFVRAQAEDGTDLRVEIDLVSAERAQDLLNENPKLFSDEPDAAAKLRRLQTFVQCTIAWRCGFRVADPSRARRVMEPPSLP